jgi:hypothetical protein
MDRTMSFDEVKLPQGFQAKYIGKKFYGKYYCKLVLKIDPLLIKKTNISTGHLRWSRMGAYTNRFELLDKLVKEVKQLILNDDYRLRAEGKNISIFTNDVNDLNLIIERLPVNFCELYMPINNNHTEVLNNHRSVVVRNSLFDKKYKFKIYMKPYYELREARYSNVKEYLENVSDYGLNSGMYQFFNTGFSSRRIGWTAAVYLNDPSDLMMFQLRFDDYIMKIEEAVLIDDL